MHVQLTSGSASTGQRAAAEEKRKVNFWGDTPGNKGRGLTPWPDGSIWSSKAAHTEGVNVPVKNVSL